MIDVCVKGFRKSSQINSWRGIPAQKVSSITRIIARLEQLGILSSVEITGSNDKSKLIVAPVDDFLIKGFM